ncbi:hypothetical protein [Corynebacterium xerosis]|uniref:hypothetical protein n=1 Tax=Corynebacterium xerosis TaxID=1725 RepID=UPI00076712C4|nr:hypothetical protein [Corynebacterium xerosis]SQB95374.1 Uncharacterised protein [Clostridium paraputrificum]
MTDGTTRPDPLAPLMDLEGVAEAAERAAEAISAVHRHRANLRKWTVTGAESVLRGARASAWLEGGEPALPADGDVTDPTLAAALRAADPIAPEAIDETVRVWRRAPIQVLARLALIASPTGPELADAPTDARSSEAGRPVGDDKLSAAMKEQRLHLLGDLVSGGTSVPDPVLSAVVHGELLTMRPFAANNGIVARAASRLTTIAGGSDPRGLAVPEVHWTRHRDEYRAAAEAFASGGPEGVRRWILLHLAGLEAGAVEARGIAESV